MALLDFLRRQRKDSSEVRKYKKDLHFTNVRAKHDAKLRREINARLHALQIEADNLTRQAGGKK